MARRMSSATGAPVFSDSLWSLVSWSSLRNRAVRFMCLYYTTDIHISTQGRSRTRLESVLASVLSLLRFACTLAAMLIGQRLKELRESKNLSQGDVEKRTGLLRCYTSRVENGHTVPAVETLEKYARALEVPLYRLFYEGNEPPQKPKLPATPHSETAWGANGGQRRELNHFARALSRMNDQQRRLLLAMATRMASRGRQS